MPASWPTSRKSFTRVVDDPTGLSNDPNTQMSATQLNQAYDEIEALEALLVPPAGVPQAVALIDPRATPPTSLNALFTASSSGGTITLGPYAYRESLYIDHAVTINGSGGSSVRPSTIWDDTKWFVPTLTTAPDVYRSTQALPSVTVEDTTTGVSGSYTALNYVEVVCYDHLPLRRVSHEQLPDKGEYSVDRYGYIRLGDDPRGHLIEVGTSQYAIQINGVAVTLNNLDVRHAASRLGGNLAAIQEAGNVGALLTMSNCTVMYNHGCGVGGPMAPGTSLTGCEIAYNGGIGFDISEGTWTGSNLLTAPLTQSTFGTQSAPNLVHHNGTKGYNSAFSAGGGKFTNCNNWLIQYCQFYNNAGPGLWPDIHNTEMQIHFCLIHHNTGPGFMFEISGSQTYYVPGPAVPTVSHAAAGTAIGAGTYSVSVAYTTSTGESQESTAASITLAAGDNLTVNSPSSSQYGATGYYIYVSGAGNTTRTRQGGQVSLGTNTTLTALTTTGSAPSTGQNYITNYTGAQSDFSYNIVWENCWGDYAPGGTSQDGGLFISTSHNIAIHDNLIAWNGMAINFMWDWNGRYTNGHWQPPTGSVTTPNNFTFYNNAIIGEQTLPNSLNTYTPLVSVDGPNNAGDRTSVANASNIGGWNNFLWYRVYGTTAALDTTTSALSYVGTNYATIAGWNGTKAGLLAGTGHVASSWISTTNNFPVPSAVATTLAGTNTTTLPNATFRAFVAAHAVPSAPEAGHGQGQSTTGLHYIFNEQVDDQVLVTATGYSIPRDRRVTMVRCSGTTFDLYLPHAALWDAVSMGDLVIQRVDTLATCTCNVHAVNSVHGSFGNQYIQGADQVVTVPPLVTTTFPSGILILFTDGNDWWVKERA